MEIILIGFMGSGKTTVGEQLGRLTNQPVYDLDSAIEKTAQQSIPEIFQQVGEQGFRDLEHQVLADTIHQSGILATGGGAPLRPDNQQLISQSGALVVWLRASLSETIERIQQQAGDRPIADSLNPEGLQKLMQERQPIYQQCADLVIQTDQLTPAEIAQRILHSKR